MLGYGVLVGEYCSSGVRCAGIDGVDAWHDGEEVLELVEVVGRCRDCTVEGVEEGGVEGSEGELGDDV